MLLHLVWSLSTSPWVQTLLLKNHWFNLSVLLPLFYAVSICVKICVKDNSSFVMQPLFKGNQGLLLRDSVKKPMTHSLSLLSVCLLLRDSVKKPMTHSLSPLSVCLLLRDSVKKPMTHSLSPLSVCLLFISSPTKLSSLLKCSFKCLTLHQLLSFCYLSPPSRFNTLHARICFFYSHITVQCNKTFIAPK